MIFSMFLSNQNHLLTPIYTFTISVHSFDKCDISISLPRQYRNFNCCTYKYVIETLSWINGYFFSAGCNLCTLYNHILFKTLLKSEATSFVDLNFIAGSLWMAYIKNMPCLCFPFFLYHSFQQFESQSTWIKKCNAYNIIQKNFMYELGIILTITYGQLILNLHQWHKKMQNILNFSK